MAILSAEEVWSGRRGNIDDKAVREYVRIYRVITDSTLDGPATILAAFSLVIFQTYQDANGTADTGAVLKKISPQQDEENPYLWQVVCDYSSMTADQQYNEQNPLDRPARYTWSSQKFQKLITRDRDENDIKASNNENYPPQEIDDTRRFLTVVRNEDTFPDDLAERFQDALNDSEWLGHPAGTVKCESITGNTNYENNVFFWEVRYEFAVRKSLIDVEEISWAKRLVDEGSYYLSGGVRATAEINGVPRPTPVQLDGSGGLLGEGDSQHFKTYHVYPEEDFSDLNIDPPP